MDACASYFYHIGVVNIYKDDLKLRISTYISENINEKLSVNGICNTFGISRSALYGMFNNSFGVPVSKYIFQKRMDLACKKLINTNDSITEIAAEVGISNYTYLIRAF